MNAQVFVCNSNGCEANKESRSEEHCHLWHATLFKESLGWV